MHNLETIISKIAKKSEYGKVKRKEVKRIIAYNLKDGSEATREMIKILEGCELMKSESKRSLKII